MCSMLTWDMYIYLINQEYLHTFRKIFCYKSFNKFGMKHRDLVKIVKLIIVKVSLNIQHHSLFFKQIFIFIA